jgi:hypothetical protein
VADFSLEVMLFQYNHLSLPMGFIDNNYSINYNERKVGDKTFPALDLLGSDGPSMSVTINPDAGLIQLAETRISPGPREILMGVGHDDYREVAGVMLAHRMINFVNDRVSLNPVLIL